MGWSWSLVTIAGPIILLSVMVYITVRNRKAKRSTIERSDRAAAKLRDDIDKDPKYD